MSYVDKLPEILETLRRQREENARVREGTASLEEEAASKARTEAAKDHFVGGMDALYDDAAGSALPPGMSFEDNLVETGKIYQAHSLAHTEDEDAALNLLLAWLAEKYKKTRNPQYAEAHSIVSHAMGEAVYFVAAKWSHFGLNKVKLDPKYAASLICTRLSSEVFEHVALPWPTFLIDVPDGLIPLKEGDCVQYLLVDHWKTAGMYRVSVISKRLRQSALLSKTVAGLAAEKPDKEDTVFLGDSDSLRKIVGRLIVGACLALTDPTTHRIWAPIGSRKHTFGNARKGSNPAVRIYQVGKPVTVDCRPIVQEYLCGDGKGKKLNVQFFVLGYWKMQHHGPRGSLRRWQQVTGHWKGPKDAPINVRPHVLKVGGP